MTILDLAKATLACGGLAFLIYNYPVVGQVLLIAGLSLLWLGYFRQTLLRLRRH